MSKHPQTLTTDELITEVQKNLDKAIANAQIGKKIAARAELIKIRDLLKMEKFFRKEPDKCQNTHKH